jgi:hypothetical protein
VHLDSSVHVPDNLAVGSQVTVVATFQGQAYAVQSIEVNAGPDQAKVSSDDNDLATQDQTSSENGKHSKKSKKKD